MTIDANARPAQVWAFPPAMERLRIGVAAWLVLAVIGWAAAGVAAVVAVHTYQAAEKWAAAAGLTPVTGPGIELVLSDATQALPPGENPSMALVQDSDLVFLNMMLWYGGARAVAINGERITAQSTITSSGPTLIINRRRVVGPFHVVVIGDPQVLRGVLETRGGFADRMRESGLGVAMTSRPDLVVQASNTNAL